MALIDLQTDLKSLKYGKDRIGGGSSNQPFVQKPIPDSFSAVGNTGGLDVLTRGGTLAISRTADDVSRLSKLLLTGNTFQGPFFTIKQNTLSNQSVRTQGTTGQYNQGKYSPTNTLVQAGLSAVQGNEDLLKGFTPYSEIVPVRQEDTENRLVGLYNQNFADNQITIQKGLAGFQSNTGNLLEYNGGPGASLTGGKTFIKFADQRTGRNNPQLVNFFGAPGVKNPLFDQLNTGDLGLGIEGYRSSIPTVKEYVEGQEPVIALGYSAFTRKPITELSGGIFASGVTNLLYSSNLVNTQASRILKTQYKKETANSKLPENSQNFLAQQKDILQFSKGGTPSLLSYDQILESTPFKGGTVFNPPDDFRLKTNLKKQAPSSSFYRNLTYELGDPGYKDINRNVDPSSAVEKNTNTTDLINFKKIEDTTTPADANKDLIPFYIGVYGYGTGGDQSVQFRAFLNSFNDSFNGEWNAFRYMGRGENFYTYDGFSREISLTFSVHAQSKAELLSQYTRLNFLASLLAPKYSNAGFMRGNFLTLTVGDYLIEVPGILTSLSYTIPTESPWDIGRKNDVTLTNGKDRLPHLIEVNTFSFKPIHNFIPAKGKPFISAVS